MTKSPREETSTIDTNKKQKVDEKKESGASPAKTPSAEESISKTPSQDSEKQDRLGRFEFFMAIAELARLKSSDPNLKVGCCLVDSATREIISLGYNGFVQGFENSPESWGKQSKEKYLQHAEANALHFAAPGCFSDRDVIAFVTCHPCERCASALMQKRVSTVIFNIAVEKYFSEEAKDMFKKADIKACFLQNVCKEGYFLGFKNLETYDENMEKSDQITSKVTRYTCDRGVFEVVTTKEKTIQTLFKNYEKYEKWESEELKNLFETDDFEHCKKSIENSHLSKTVIPKFTKIEQVPKKMVTSWHQLFMSIALLASRRCRPIFPHEDSKLKVVQSGCCIAKGSKIISYGYTGLPQSLLNKKQTDAFSSYYRGAIENALSFAKADVSKATIYSSTKPQQYEIVQAMQKKIGEIVYLDNQGIKEKNDDLEWKYIKSIAREGGLILSVWDHYTKIGEKIKEAQLLYETEYIPLDQSERSSSYGIRKGDEVLHRGSPRSYQENGKELQKWIDSPFGITKATLKGANEKATEPGSPSQRFLVDQ